MEQKYNDFDNKGKKLEKFVKWFGIIVLFWFIGLNFILYYENIFVLFFVFFVSLSLVVIGIVLLSKAKKFQRKNLVIIMKLAIFISILCFLYSGYELVMIELASVFGLIPGETNLIS